MTNDIQQRGHCQMCGRQQAVKSGHMAHHGYTVDYGFFNGTCPGHDFAPIEHSRADLDKLVGIMREKANQEAERAVRLHSGTEDPEYIIVRRSERKAAELHRMSRYVEVEYFVPFCYGDEYEQDRARRILVSKLEGSAQSRRAFADMMVALADKVHGQPLLQVAKDKGPAPLARKVKTPQGNVLTMSYMERGRVYWKSDNGRSAWMGTQAWRKYEVVEQ